MPDDEKGKLPAPNEETKPPDRKESPSLIFDITDRLPPGWGVSM